MSETAATAFDFRQPCRLDMAIEHRIMAWQKTACKLIPDKWSSYFPFAASWSPLNLETIQPAAHELPTGCQAFRLMFDGRPHVTLLGFPAVLGIGLVQGILGEVPNETPADRLLTDIESSLLEVVVQLMLEALNEAAVSCGVPSCELAGQEPAPHLIRLFPGVDELVMLTVRISMPFGDQDFFWIWPEPLADQLFPVDRGPSRVEVQDELQQLAKRIPMDLSVRLGEANIDVSDLASLSVGDVIVLDQRVSEPLQCFLSDQLFMEGWPGQRSSRRAIQIQRVVDA